MTTWARDVDGVLVEVATTDPTILFHPTIAEQFIVVPDGLVAGATEVDGVWTNPPPPPPPPPYVQPPPSPPVGIIADSARSLALADVHTMVAAGRTDEALAALANLVEQQS